MGKSPRLKLHTDSDKYPQHTPLYAKCIDCDTVLPYPPIQIPGKPVPTEQALQWSIKWDNHCISCAIKKLKRLKATDLVPDKAWEAWSALVIDNPYRRNNG